MTFIPSRTACQTKARLRNIKLDDVEAALKMSRRNSVAECQFCKLDAEGSTPSAGSITFLQYYFFHISLGGIETA